MDFFRSPAASATAFDSTFEDNEVDDSSDAETLTGFGQSVGVNRFGQNVGENRIGATSNVTRLGEM